VHPYQPSSQGPRFRTGLGDMFKEDEDDSWFDWVCDNLICCTCSLLNIFICRLLRPLYYFSSYRPQLDIFVLSDTHLQPHAPIDFFSFVSERQICLDCYTDTTTTTCLVSCWNAFVIFWRFLLNIPASTSGNTSTWSKTQQLEIWSPGDLEKDLFLIYSPASASCGWPLIVLIGSSYLLSCF